MNETIIWKNGAPLSDKSDFSMDRGFLYGDAFFTTIAISHKKIGLQPYHLKRLENAAKQLSMKVQWEKLEEYLANFTRIIQTGIIKILVSRGTGSRGYLPPEQAVDIYFYGHTGENRLNHLYAPALQQPINITVLQGRVGYPMTALVGLKTTDRIEQVLLRQEAAQHGYTEGLCFDLSNQLISGISTNCFLYHDQTWHTPDLTNTGIQGTCRAFLIDQFKSKDLPLIIQSIDQSMLQQAESIFLSNALGIYPVQMLNKQALDLKNIDNLFNQIYA